ncbi:gamma-glutamylcyclotransferase [Belnapia rosea]|uniref:glutathione-specific gamma-glutamylcyclotransferase n=1 Tax=Belnapia rosea TaxID=938405 RepID=A0A1G6SHH6_9PROT|nr:gamma-glutamylcyclotransferase [Belnapia rosea]SDD16319.1 cation transport protein ChaC [Belnapia rosea]
MPDTLPEPPLYVFAYGSLIWRPGFTHEGMHPALLRGFHRRFCLTSRHYRGTAEVPGLVLGLDRGGACRGVAFRVAAGQAEAVLAYLDARENLAGEAVYTRRRLPVRLLDSGRMVHAVTYVADRRHGAYCRPEAEVAAATIARGVGQAGANRDYLMNTVQHLRALGIRDAALDRIAALLPPASETV